MDDNQNERQPNQVVEEAKAAAKTAAKNVAKTALKQGSSIVLKYIGAALAPILPYIIAVVLLVLLFFGVYLGIESQADEILTGTGDLAEKVGNALSGYGFKNEDQVEEQEEEKFYQKLEFYQKLFAFLGRNLTNYELALIQRTLLYEGNAEDRVYYTEETEKNDVGDFIFNASGGIFENIGKFMKAYNLTYVQGFTNSFMGSSKFKKRNKLMNELVVVVYKCQSLTGEHGGQDNFNACYRGYLVADFDTVADCLVEEGKISYNIKPNYLVFDSGNGILSWIANIKAKYDNAEDKSQSLWLDFANNENVQTIAPGLSIIINVVVKISDEIDSLEKMKDIITMGKRAKGNPDEHFYYRGYISTNLREYYKGSAKSEDEYFSYVDPNGIGTNENGKCFYQGDFDEEKFNLEVQLREEIATDIFDFTDSYYMLEYGEGYFIVIDKSNIITVSKVNEENMMVSVTIDGENVDISFEDYVKLTLLQTYGEDIFTGDKNVLNAAVIHARTLAYMNATQTQGTLNFTATGDYSDAYELLRGLNSGKKNFLDLAFSETIGKVVKDENGELLGDFKIDINSINSGSTADDIIGGYGGKVENKNIYGSPFPTIGNLRDVVSAGYGSDSNFALHANAHGGIDIALGRGTEISAAAGGQVIAAYNKCGFGSLESRCGAEGYGGYGNIIVVKSFDDKGIPFYTYYAHMQKGTVNFEVGDTVETGDTIGQIGSSGQSSGYHLHFEVRYGGNAKENRVNPFDFFGI